MKDFLFFYDFHFHDFHFYDFHFYDFYEFYFHDVSYLQEFSFIAALTAAADFTGDLCLYNPMLSITNSDGLVCSAMLLMMTSNRITHATLALQQAKTLLKVIQKQLLLISQSNYNNNHGSQQFTNMEQLNKELSTQSDNLAVTLAMKRFYTIKGNSGVDVYEVDPRFLLFEFCHGLLLRPSQVHLVNKLLEEMEAGNSVCHQVRDKQSNLNTQCWWTMIFAAVMIGLQKY